jgi:transposase
MMGRACGKVLLENEIICPEHGEKKSNENLEIWPWTCKFVISQEQGKDRSRSRKGLECGEICVENQERCKSHSKSENHVVEMKDCCVLEFRDEKGQLEESKIIMPKKEIPSTFTRTFLVRINPDRSQRQVYNKIAGDCRMTYNILVSKQNELSPDVKAEDLRSGLVNNLPEELEYLTQTPKDCRDFVVREFVSALKNSSIQREQKIKFQEVTKKWCKEMDYVYQPRKMKLPVINFRTRKQDQSVNMAKSAVTLLPKKVKIYSNFFEDPIKLHPHVSCRDKKYKEILRNGLKHDVKMIKKRSGKFYLAIPYDVSLKPKAPRKPFVSGDPGVKTFFTTCDFEGKQIAFGDGCDDKISNIYIRLYHLNRKWKELRKRFLHKSAEKIKRRINTLEEHLKNKIRDLHYNVIAELTIYELIYIPRFGNKQMEKDSACSKTTKRHMNTLSHYQFTQRLKSKAEELGIEVQQSDEFRTTQTCTSCLKPNYIKRSRWYECKHCGYEGPRDGCAGRNNVLKYIV